MNQGIPILTPNALTSFERATAQPSLLLNDANSGVRANRGDAGRNVPYPDPLHIDVPALPYW